MQVSSRWCSGRFWFWYQVFLCRWNE